MKLTIVSLSVIFIITYEKSKFCYDGDEIYIVGLNVEITHSKDVKGIANFVEESNLA